LKEKYPDLDDLGMKGLTFTAPKKSVWFVGDNYDYDLIIPRAGIALGASFAIQNKDGQYFIRDLSNTNLKVAPSILIPKGQPHQLTIGNAIDIGTCIIFGVEEFGDKLKITYLS